jgi:hypothetical protein
MMACLQPGTPKCLDKSTDTQIIDKETTKNLNVNFKVQKFGSCEDMESVFKKFIKDYGDSNPGYRT